ncbi:MAG: Calx-beta domain-containing protein, partial [Novosphingobium sp.]
MSNNVFINEIHYDNAGSDTGEAIEVAGVAGTDLTGWSLVLYNGNGGSAYSTVSLTGVLPDQDSGYGTLSFPISGIQNGAPDGFALVDAGGNVIQFLSYEGAFAAVGGAADGMMSTDIGVAETSSTPAGYSLQLTGTGTQYSDFTWASGAVDTFGSINGGQSFGTVSGPQPGTLSMADASIAEGDSGSTDMVFTVTRTGGSDGAVSADWSLTLGTADSSDLGAGAALSGTVNFADGEISKEIHVPIVGDTAFEADETFTIDLANAQGGATLGQASATGTIINDDTAPATGPANLWVNEIHYDNSGADTGEAIEIAGIAGTDLTGYSLVLYNGSNTPDAAPTYGSPIALSGVIDDEGQGYGAVAFDLPSNGLQNGAADGFALVAPDGSVVQLLSYEGTFTAAPGTPAAGMTSTDIGVFESSGPVGQSLQLTGAGAVAGDFAWQNDAVSSFGSLNAGQTIIGDFDTGQVFVSDVAVAEGDSGATAMTFTVHRAGGLGQSAGVDYQIALDGTANAADLAPGAVLAGHVDFAKGVSAVTVSVPVQGDTLGEDNETLSIALSNPNGNIEITGASAVGTIVNDDPIALSIMQIQGAGPYSDYVGQSVSTTGIVTAVDSNGFYLQDASGDGDAATSDAVFVFTGSAPVVTVGDGVSVSGTVSEYA